MLTRAKAIPHCFDIWMCDLVSSEGSVQGGYRPALVLSNDRNNTYSPTVNIIPITSKMNKRNLPIHVEIWNHSRFGLKTPSTLLVEQIRTIPIESLDKRIGHIDDKGLLNKIKRAMSIQFPVLALVSQFS
jgi:mRNA interferase MazF